MVGIGAFWVFMRTRLNIEHYSPLKPTKVGFIFIGPNSLSPAEDLDDTFRKTTISSTLLLRYRFQGYHCESDITIFS